MLTQMAEHASGAGTTGLVSRASERPFAFCNFVKDCRSLNHLCAHKLHEVVGEPTLRQEAAHERQHT